MVLNTGHLNHWAIAGKKIIEIIKIDRQEIKLLNRIKSQITLFKSSCSQCGEPIEGEGTSFPKIMKSKGFFSHDIYFCVYIESNTNFFDL